MSTKKKSQAKKKTAPGKIKASNGAQKHAGKVTGQAWERGESVACSPNQADPLQTETVGNEKLDD